MLFALCSFSTLFFTLRKKKCPLLSFTAFNSMYPVEPEFEEKNLTESKEYTTRDI